MNNNYRFFINCDSQNLINKEIMPQGLTADKVVYRVQVGNIYNFINNPPYFIFNSIGVSGWDFYYKYQIQYQGGGKSSIQDLPLNERISLPDNSATVYIHVSANSDLSEDIESELLAGMTFQVPDLVEVFPVYGNDFELSYEKEDNQEFFRKKLNGELKFKNSDYDFIISAPFDAKFFIDIYTESKAIIYKGTFVITDCEIDYLLRTIVVELTENDEYTDFINGLDKEFDLIKLGIAKEPITYYKRAALQVYPLGGTRLGWQAAGTYWETEVSKVYDNATSLERIHFGLYGQITEIKVEAITSDPDTLSYAGLYAGNTIKVIRSNNQTFKIYNQETKHYIQITYKTANSAFYWQLYDANGDLRESFGVHNLESFTVTDYDYRYTVIVTDYYGRLLCDVDRYNNKATYSLSSADISDNNRNYKKCIGLYAGLGSVPTGCIMASSVIEARTIYSDEPTEWGINSEEQYYTSPGKGHNPLIQTEWIYSSVWIDATVLVGLGADIQDNMDKQALADGYEFSSCISAILKQISTNIIHKNTSEYSEFLYGSNPIMRTFRLYLTQKSNILNGEYTQPAQKAPVTMRSILDMLANVFKCYCIIEDNKLKIEHISFFRNGLSYTEVTKASSIPIDLRAKLDAYNKKSIIFATSKIKYNKPDLPVRFEYGWMDDCTEPFMGYKSEVKSNLVQPDNVQKIKIDNFSTDLSYSLLMSSDLSNDGFFILATNTNTEKTVIDESFVFDGVTSTRPNGTLAFGYLQSNCLLYDLPAETLLMGDAEVKAKSIKPYVEQEITFYIDKDFNDDGIYRPVITNLGQGIFDSLSINLVSGKAKAVILYQPFK